MSNEDKVNGTLLLNKISMENDHDLDDLISGSSLEDRQSVRSCQEAGCPMDALPTEMGRIDVNVIPAAFHRTDSYQCSKMPVYEMCHRPRGLALIIDIEVYENNVQERRYGSNVDVDNMRELLVGMEFSVTVYRNLHLGQFFKQVAEFCSDKMHIEGDMAVVVILSHGKDGVVYASDGQSIHMEYIYEFFNNRNCPNLIGKPKFFIVQACRGNRPDQGVEIIPKMADSRREAIKRQSDAVDAIGGNLDTGDVCKAKPTWEDMIIAYSTIPGYVSLRDHEKGTWFVQSLVEVFMAHAHDTELIDLLRMTSERLSHFTNEQGEKQTCNVEIRHLYKRIYFNPGLVVATNPTSISRSFSNPPYVSDLQEHEERKTWKTVRSNSMPHSGNVGKSARLLQQAGERSQNIIQIAEEIDDSDESCLLTNDLRFSRSQQSRAKTKFLKLIYNFKKSKYEVNHMSKRKR